MKKAFYIDENGTRIMLDIPENAEDLTESYNSSRTVALLLEQHKEQQTQNKRQFWISLITTIISVGALIVSIVALGQTP